MNITRITAAIVCLTLLGAGCFNADDSSQQIREVTESVTSHAAAMNDALATNLANHYQPSNSLCTSAPSERNGNRIYPIDQAYGDLYFLGQFFTAMRCGPEHVSHLYGVEGDRYTLGSSIVLQTAPDQKLLDTLKRIGFACAEVEQANDAMCLRWELLNTVSLDTLYELEPFHDRIEIDDCRNCG